MLRLLQRAHFAGIGPSAILLPAGGAAMKIRLPKPMHGWREFAGEVGIIVLGVLIALAADQLVDDWKARGDLRLFKSALVKEASYNLGAYDYRLRQSDCVNKRIAEPQKWDADWRSGSPARLAGPIGRPTNLSVLTSVWAARTGEVVGQMALDERLAFSRLYDSLKNLEDIASSEREVWRELSEFEVAAHLDDAQLMRLHGLIERAANLNRFVQLNTQTVTEFARPLGIRPTHEPNEVPPLDNLCEPVR